MKNFTKKRSNEFKNCFQQERIYVAFITAESDFACNLFEWRVIYHVTLKLSRQRDRTQRTQVFCFQIFVAECLRPSVAVGAWLWKHRTRVISAQLSVGTSY